MATTVTDKECVEYARECVRLACLSSRQRSVVAQGKLQSEIARALGKQANL
jgi:DNA-binding NarL/FixJ family response regulator